MQAIAERLLALRESINVSQYKMAEYVGAQQSSIYRYEHNTADPSTQVLLKYAEYFDVSLDYIFGRTDDPRGMVCEGKMKSLPESPEVRKFIEMCFDPESPMSERLKAVLYEMMMQKTEKTE